MAHLALILPALLLPALLLPGTARAEAPACPDPGDAVDRVEAAVLEARFDDARDASARAEAAFGCTGRADAPLLARLFIAEGAMAHIEGDAGVRDRAFASARRVSPDTWTAAFGAELQAAWQAVDATPAGQGRLELEGLPEGAAALLDGQPTQVPAELESGLYLVQAATADSPPVFARIVLVPEDQTLVVHVDPDQLGAPATSLATSPAAVEPRRSKLPWLAAAGGAVALSATSAVLARTQDPALQDASGLTDLDAAYGRQKTFAYASYGLGGLGVALLGVGIAW